MGGIVVGYLATPEGRAAYREQQAAFAAEAGVLRERLLAAARVVGASQGTVVG